MIDPTELAAWVAQVGRLILRYMSLHGVPTTRDQRWMMARRLHPTVEQMRRDAYVRTAARLRAQGLQPAPLAPYRPQALVAAIERATNAEPYVRPERREAAREEAPLERVEPQPEQEPALEPSNRTAEPRSRVRVTAPAQQPRSRVRVQVAANDLDPQTRRQARTRVEVTDGNRTEPAVIRGVTERVTATVERHIRQVDRETVTATADALGEEVGWARVLSGAENCAWCAMLASRGPVYKSDKSALTVVGRRGGRTRGTRQLGERYHDFCDCDCVLVRQGQDWAGREEFERLQRMWAAASATHPEDAERAFNRSWRRIQRHPELEEDYHRLWDESTQGLEGGDALRAFAAAARIAPPEALDTRRRTPSSSGGDSEPPDSTPGTADGELPSLPQRRPRDAARGQDSLESATTPEEVAEYIARRHGVTTIGFSGDELPMEPLREYARAIDDIVAQFPDIELPDYVGISEEDERDYALTSGLRNRDDTWSCMSMLFNRHYMENPDLMQERMRANVAAGFHPPGSDDRPFYSTVVHELGHVLDYQGNVRASDRAVQVLGDYFQTNVERSKDKAVLAARYIEWLNTLSGYGRLNERGRLNPPEAVAVAFADVILNGDAASEPARVLYRLLIESKDGA